MTKDFNWKKEKKIIISKFNNCMLPNKKIVTYSP